MSVVRESIGAEQGSLLGVEVHYAQTSARPGLGWARLRAQMAAQAAAALAVALGGGAG